MVRALNLEGQRFGRLTVLCRVQGDKPRAHWLCRCDCGNEIARISWQLTGGVVKSCGCIAADKAAAKVCDSRAYRSWAAMKSRCLNPNDSSYADYGGRGISVCGRWMEFDNFLADMGHPPAGMTLDRRENAGNYEPGNCRWATKLQQQNNMRSNRLVEFAGRIQTVAEWSREMGLATHVIRKRLNRGWCVQAALSTPKSEEHAHGRAA